MIRKKETRKKYLYPLKQISALWIQCYCIVLWGVIVAAIANSLWPMDCRTPGFPVLHYLLEFAQTHVHWVSDAIQPSHVLSLPFPPALNLPDIRVFSSELALCIKWPKYWNFNFSISPSNEYSGLISFMIDWFDILATFCPELCRKNRFKPPLRSLKH